MLGNWLAWASMAVPACCRICERVRFAVSLAKSASMIRPRAELRLLLVVSSEPTTCSSRLKPAPGCSTQVGDVINRGVDGVNRGFGVCCRVHATKGGDDCCLVGTTEGGLQVVAACKSIIGQVDVQGVGSVIARTNLQFHRLVGCCKHVVVVECGARLQLGPTSLASSVNSRFRLARSVSFKVPFFGLYAQFTHAPAGCR